MVTLTDIAAEKVRSFIGQQQTETGDDVGLRVGVRGGGCSGFQYVFDLVDHSEPEDVRIERDGAAALVDDVSLPFLAGSEIDFVDELVGAQFKVKNPNAASSCGCGVSFSV